jgi:tetratricopeptide (TPR) repeat protein
VRLGELCFRTGEWDAAAAHYRRALALSPGDAPALLRTAELHAARGEHEPALKLAAQAIAESPRPEFHHHHGDLLVAAGDVQGAIDAHERALTGYLASVQAGHAQHLLDLASLFNDVEAFRDPREAQRWANAALKVRRTVDTFHATAWALYHAERYPDAAATMDKGPPPAHGRHPRALPRRA